MIGEKRQLVVNPSFWSRRRVLLTGHTGFKGAWAAAWLAGLGAEVTGLSLPAETAPSLTALLSPDASVDSRIGDITDADWVKAVVQASRPEVVLHMAAQSLVRRSYREPAATFMTNVMGTVNLLDALREVQELRAVLVVTSDKVYENLDDGRRFSEGDRLGGADPYSASKAAAEIVAASYAHSFFERRGIAVATARAGNVIGGGDWSEDRLVPDLWRAANRGESLALRYPNSTRPWQHALEPLSGYFCYIQRLADDRAPAPPSALNFGPSETTLLTVAEVAEAFSASRGLDLSWHAATGQHPPEKTSLTIDPSMAIRTLGWRPSLGQREAIDWTADWYRAFDEGRDMRAVTFAQIQAYTAILAHRGREMPAGFILASQ